jgi:hypothetical protein
MLRHPRSKQGRTQFLEAEIDKKMKTEKEQKNTNSRISREQLKIEKKKCSSSLTRRREIKREEGKKKLGKKGPVDIVG